MCKSNGDDVAVDIQTIPWGGQEHVVKTTFGPLSVFVCGNQGKPALITYPDVALNYTSCFRGLFLCSEASSLLLHNFSIYHIDAPGHELGATTIPWNEPDQTVDNLADQVAEVLDYFDLQKVMCMGVTAGAYILTLFALKHQERVQGLIVVSPLCRAPCWTEWLYNMLIMKVLHYYGMCSVVKEALLQRYFSQDLRVSSGAELDIVQTFRKLLDERESRNVVRFLHAINRRKDLTDSLRKLKCRTLTFVGEHSPFRQEAMHLNSVTDNVLVEVPGCGSLLTEEQPNSMAVPIEYFLVTNGFYTPAPPVSPLSPLCISPHLLSPESLGIKLKPIKTRVILEEKC